MVVSNTLLCSPPLGEMIQFDSYFLDGLKPPTTYELSFEEVSMCVFLGMAIVQGPVEISKRFGLPLIKRPKRVSVWGPRIFRVFMGI